MLIHPSSNLVFKYMHRRLKAEAASGKRSYFTNFRPGTPSRRQVTLLESFVYRDQGGGIIYRKTGLKVSDVATIRDTSNYQKDV